MERIASNQNARVKRLALLMRDRRERAAQRLFVAEGLRLCLDAAGSGVKILEAYMTAAACEKHPELRLLDKAADESFEIGESIADKLSDTKTAQGVFALCEMPELQRPCQHAENARYLLLSSLQDPGNVGTIIRTAEAVGLGGLCLSADCPELYSPKVLRATMGGAFRLPVWTADDMCGEIAALRRESVRVFAAALHENAERLGGMRFDGPCAVVLGNEGTGLSRDVVEACDGVVMIPMRGRADSLGVAAAAAIFSWEMSK